MLSNLIAPLCMMVIGATFVNVSFREVFCDGKLLIFSVVRLLVIPFVFMFLLRKITDNVLLQNVAFIVIATPAGSMAAMLAQQYDATKYVVFCFHLICFYLLNLWSVIFR